jgi:hypothetical protein
MPLDLSASSCGEAIVITDAVSIGDQTWTYYEEPFIGYPVPLGSGGRLWLHVYSTTLQEMGIAGWRNGASLDCIILHFAESRNQVQFELLLVEWKGGRRRLQGRLFDHDIGE